MRPGWFIATAVLQAGAGFALGQPSLPQPTWPPAFAPGAPALTPPAAPVPAAAPASGGLSFPAAVLSPPPAGLVVVPPPVLPPPPAGLVVVPPPILPPPPAAPFVAPPEVEEYQPTQEASAYPYFMWGRAEYLLWGVKNGRQPPPLVTTGPAAAGAPAVFTAPGTVVLYPTDQVEYGGFSGGRFAIGSWFNACESCGAEVAGFVLERRSRAFQAASGPNGAPVLGIPFIDAGGGAERVNDVAFPGRIAGGVRVASDLRLWGMEGTLLGNRFQTVVRFGDSPVPFGDFRLDLLGGFRYLSLSESLDVTAPSVVLANGARDFSGAPVAAFDSLVTRDGFAARTQFFGGQIGARGEFARGPAYVEVLCKVALGDSHEVVRVNGNTTLTSAATGASGVAPGGFLATSTNIGRLGRDRLSVVPEVGVNVGYLLFPQMRLYAGYTFLYWNNVVRAGDQVDRTVNLTGVPTSGVFGQSSGPDRPAVPFRTTDFWAQGVDFGLEMRF